MESIIRDHVVKYFLDNDLFTNRQYGFLKVRSTVLQLLNITDDWTIKLDLGGQTDCIYFDFAGIEEYTRPSELIGLHWIGLIVRQVPLFTSTSTELVWPNQGRV